jgi:hypothetical protein
MAERQPALVTPFWVRIAAETSLSPGWLLVAFPAVLYPAYLLLEALFGRGLAAAMDFVGDFEARSLPFWAASLGYISMMGVYVARGTLRDLDALRQVLTGGEAAYVELRQQLIRFERRRLWVGGLAGLAFFCLGAELSIERWTRLVAGEWSLRATCAVAAGSALWIVLGRVTVYLVDSARLYSRIGERSVAVDLLDLAPLSRLARHGLRIVLLLVIIWAPGVATWTVGNPFASSSPTTFAIFGGLWLVPLAAAVFVLPVRGLRRQIRTRKADKLTQLREEIRRDEELAAKLGPDSAQAGARLPGLLAFEKRIESVREWPFDSPTLTRFFLYVAIPLGSWVGGALVERLLGAALD